VPAASAIRRPAMHPPVAGLIGRPDSVLGDGMRTPVAHLGHLKGPCRFLRVHLLILSSLPPSVRPVIMIQRARCVPDATVNRGQSRAGIDALHGP
jgi:hypothetical protein